MNISILVRRCLEKFKLLSGSESRNLDRVVDEYGRFRVWAGNVSAHTSGRRSLQHRLRDSSELLAAVTGYLNELLEALDDVSETASDNEEDDDPSEDASDEGDHDLFEVGDSGPRDLQALEELSEIISCLMRISMALRNPARNDQVRYTETAHAKLFEPRDIEHVRMKFPSATDHLTQRVGKSISRHRQYFKYRKEHHERLSHGIDGGEEGDEKDKQSTAATSLFRPEQSQSVTFHEESDAESVDTTTSYAQSETGDSTLRPPSRPSAAADDLPFECTICYHIVNAPNERLWRQHVYEDLPPYVCMYEDCKAGTRQFSRRRDWRAHMKDHFRYWICPYGCSTRFDASAQHQEHVRSGHTGQLSETTMLNLSESCARESEPPSLNCPFCGHEKPTQNAWFKHVGHHLEQLALFALPKHLLAHDSDEDDDERLSLSEGERISEDMDLSGEGPDFKGLNTISDLELTEVNVEDLHVPQIQLTDMVGRIHILPLETCKHWMGMTAVVRQLFDEDDEIADWVHQGRYTLSGPDGRTITPYDWPSVVKRGWNVSMHLSTSPGAELPYEMVKTDQVEETDTERHDQDQRGLPRRNPRNVSPVDHHRKVEEQPGPSSVHIESESAKLEQAVDEQAVDDEETVEHPLKSTNTFGQALNLDWWYHNNSTGEIVRGSELSEHDTGYSAKDWQRLIRVSPEDGETTVIPVEEAVPGRPAEKIEERQKEKERRIVERMVVDSVKARSLEEEDRRPITRREEKEPLSGKDLRSSTLQDHHLGRAPLENSRNDQTDPGVAIGDGLRDSSRGHPGALSDVEFPVLRLTEDDRDILRNKMANLKRGKKEIEDEADRSGLKLQEADRRRLANIDFDREVIETMLKDETDARWQARAPEMFARDAGRGETSMPTAAEPVESTQVPYTGVDSHEQKHATSVGPFLEPEDNIVGTTRAVNEKQFEELQSSAVDMVQQLASVRLGPAQETDTDVLYLRHQKQRYPMQLAAGSIAAGHLTLLQLHTYAAKELRVDSPHKLIFKGKTLGINSSPCASAGIENGAEIMVIVAEPARESSSRTDDSSPARINVEENQGRRSVLIPTIEVVESQRQQQTFDADPEQLEEEPSRPGRIRVRERVRERATGKGLSMETESPGKTESQSGPVDAPSWQHEQIPKESSEFLTSSVAERSTFQAAIGFGVLSFDADSSSTDGTADDDVDHIYENEEDVSDAAWKGVNNALGAQEESSSGRGAFAGLSAAPVDLAHMKDPCPPQGNSINRAEAETDVPAQTSSLSNDARPFACDHCSQSFISSHELKRHQRIHMAVKPYGCRFCNRSFSRKDALERHMTIKGCGGDRSREVH